MTKHGGTFKLSGETRDLLRENQSFFEEILGLYDPEDPAKIPLRFKSGDPESHTEAKIQPSGDVEVSFVIPLDGDTDPENGRIYLRDTFVFDPSEKKLKDYQRSFDYNGKGQGSWQEWLGKFRETLTTNPRTIDDPTVQAFAFSAGSSFGRSITNEKGETLDEFRSAYARQHAYLDLNHQMVKKHQPSLGYKLKDAKNHYSLARKDGEIRITFNFAVDVDDEPGNGRLIMNDTISVDEKTWELKNFSRKWELPPELEVSPEWKAEADSMNKVWAETSEDEKKTLSEASEAFVRNMAPLLLTGVDLKPEDAGRALLIANKAAGGTTEPSPLAKRFMKDPRRGEATFQVLDAMGVLASESAGQQHDHDSGWWNRKILRRQPMNLEQVQKATNAVFEKSHEAAKAKPGASAFEVLKSLSLEGDEAQVRDGILTDKLMIELDSIGAETDPELRDHALLHFADQRLFRAASLAYSAQAILASLKDSAFVKAKAQEVLATLEGKGSFGNKVEAFLPRFTEQVAHPATLIAMGSAPFLGVAAEGLGLAGLSRLGTAIGWSGRVGVGGRFVASALGLTGEAFAFTAMHQAGASAVHDPNKVLANFGNEFYSGLLLFGAMRAAHAVVNPMTARVFTKKTTETELLASPTGRVLMGPRWGGGAPTAAGKLFMPIINHGTGIVGMHLANSISRHYGWMPQSGQDQFSNFLDSALSYSQAMVGFNLANRLTSGRLQSGLAEAKLSLDGLGRDAGKVPIGNKIGKVTKPPTSSGLTFKFNGQWDVDASKTKVIWIGSLPRRRKGVEYEDGFAHLNIGEEETVSAYHAVLTRDKSDTFWYVGDAGSTYGTGVNSQRLEPGEHVRLKNGSSLQLGDNFQLRVQAEGNLMSPPKNTTVFVDLPQKSSQRRLGPPSPADSFPYEMLYRDFEISDKGAVEVAELRPNKGEPSKLTSQSTTWGRAGNVKIYVDAKGRFILENLNFDSDIEFHRPARGERSEQRQTLKRFDPKTASEEEKAAGRQDWVFIESGDRFTIGTQEFEFVAHDTPLGAVGDTKRALDPPEADRGSQAKRRSEPPAPAEEPESDFEGDRVTQVDIKPVPAEAYRPSESGEITLAAGLKLTAVRRIDGPIPAKYLGKVPAGSPVMELKIGDRIIRGDKQSTSYIIGSDPEVSHPNQSPISVKGRLIERNHAEVFLAYAPDGKSLQWYLTDKDSGFGTYLGGAQGRKLDSGAEREFVPLNSGAKFTLGAPSGKSDAIEVAFRLPWEPITYEDVRPASVFPGELLRDLPADQPPMELVDNFGNILLSADRRNTRYIIGSNPDPRETANTRVVTFAKERVEDEHCELFLDDSGQWYLRALTAEETYVDSKKIIGGAIVSVPPGFEVALGGDAATGHGMTFFLKYPEYARPKSPPSRPILQLLDNNSAPENETPTVRPIAPNETPTQVPGPNGRPHGGTGPKGPPHAPPRRRATTVSDPKPGAQEIDLHSTQVMQTGTAEELARRSMELEEPPPEPSPVTVRRPTQPPSGPHVLRKTNPPPRAATPAPAPKSEPPPQAKFEAPKDEADFGDISAEVIDTAGPDDFQFGRPRQNTPGEAIPPPSSGKEVPAFPPASPVPEIGRPLVDPALTALHPALRSRALSDQLSQWVAAAAIGRDQLKATVDEYKAFPRHMVATGNVVGNSDVLPMFVNRVLRLESKAREARNNQIPVFSEAAKATLRGLANPAADADTAPNFGQVYETSFDSKTLLYSSQGFSGADTSLTLKIKSGGEASMLKGLHQQLLALDVPLQVTAPIAIDPAKSTYLGILYRAEDAAKVHRALNNFVREHGDSLGEGNLPFTQQVKGENGQPIPGVGIIEYSTDGISTSPVDQRFRQTIMESHKKYAKKSQAEGTYSQPEHHRQAIYYYQAAGYDMGNPGFREGSLKGSHQALLPFLYFPE